MAGTCKRVTLCLSLVDPGSSIAVSLTAVTIQVIPKAIALHVNSASPPSGTGEGFSSVTLLLDMTLTTSEGKNIRTKMKNVGRKGGIEEKREDEMDERREVNNSSGKRWKRGRNERRTWERSGKKRKKYAWKLS